ncbi:18433_t:CDS:2, partial [Racocetra fulgida]
QPITVQITNNNITDMQEIQNDESDNTFAFIEQLRGPNCFNYEIQQYSFKKAEYCQGIGIAKKVKSIESNDSLDDFRIVTNSHVISHHGRPKKQLQDSLEDINKPGPQKIHESNKVLHESDITNKSTHKYSYCNNTGHYAKTCSLNPNNK